VADANSFASRIRRYAVNIEANSSAIVKKAAIEISNAVIQATPVDTGRARGSWFANIGGPSNDKLPEGQHGKGGQRMSANAGLISRAKDPTAIHITNNLQYMKYLNAGSSRQAPANFVGKAISAGIAAVKGASLLGKP
jgi:HK97 gp10 family phage protein